MRKRFRKGLASLLAAAMMISGLGSGVSLKSYAAEETAGKLVEENQRLEIKAAETETTSQQYAVYPIPQSIEYAEGELIPTADMVIVADPGVDEATINYVKEVLDQYDVNYEMADSLMEGRTNILLGTLGNAGYVEQYVSGNSTETGIRTEDLFERADAHMIDVKNDRIVIYGKDADSVFRGVSTLKMMFSSFDGKKFPAAHIEDYASVESRGYIEGFYGAWDHEARLDLMRFAKDYKMNSYVYAAKGDDYHTSKWYEPYPPQLLAQFEEMARVGEETKVRFAWSVHMGKFFSGLSNIPSDEEMAAEGYAELTKFDLYRERYGKLMDKFRQLNGVGIKRFDILNDDFGSGNTSDVVLVLNRINKDLKAMGCEAITYCPQGYNESWANWAGGSTAGNYEELMALRQLDDDIKIYWTGADVNSPITQSTVDFIREKSQHSADFWLNYPVNEHAKSGIFLGHIKHYARDGVTNLAGFHSNPCRYPYASEVGLYQLACLVWNNNDYLANAETIWESAFDYLQPEVRDAYFKIANNISNAPNSGRVGDAFPESDYLEEKLNTVLTEVTRGGDYQNSENLTELRKEFTIILTAIETFENDCKNRRLVEELSPWLNSLRDLAEAGRDILNAALALKDNDLSLAWEKLSSASAAYSIAYTYKANSDADSAVAKAGSKRIYPFVTKMINYVTNALTPMLNPDNAPVVPAAYVKMAGTVRDDDTNAKKIYDGDLSTAAVWNNIQQVGDYVGLDLGRVIKVRDVEIIQGNTDTDHDIFHKAHLQYSADGEEWTNIEAEVTADGHHITADNLQIEARYVRYYLYETGTANKTDYWTHIREFTVNKPVATGDRVFTNVESLKQTPVTYEGTSVGIRDLSGITLQPGQYVGVKLQEPSVAYTFTRAGENDGNLTMEFSYNEQHWVAIDDATANAAMRYFRIINKTENPVTADIERIEANLQLLNSDTTLERSTMNGGVRNGSFDNVFDGDRSTYVETASNQQAGNYITFNLGKNIEIHDVVLVTTDGNQTFYKAKVQISTNNYSWTDIGTIENNMEFPGPPYKFFTCDGGGEKARYLRIYITENASAALKLNEIEINKKVMVNNQAEEIFSTIDGEAKNIIDNNISTAMIAAAAADDYVEYRISNNTNIQKINILMGEAGNGKAYAVKADGEEVCLGTLDKKVSEFDTSQIAPVTAVRLKWEQEENVAVHEIVLVRGDYIGSDIGVYVEPLRADGPEQQPITEKMLLSQGQPVAVSGTSDGDKAKINDGIDVNNNTNKWDSNHIKGTGNQGNTAWFSIDLGETPVLIDEVYVHYFNKIYPTQYKLQVSDDNTTWYTVKEFTKAHNGAAYPSDRLTLETPVHARYIRWFYTELNSAAVGNGVGVIEAEVYGRKINAEAEITACAETEDITLSVGEELQSSELPVFNEAVVTIAGVEETVTAKIPISFADRSVNTSVAGTAELSGEFKLSGIKNTAGKTVSLTVVVEAAAGNDVNKTELQTLAEAQNDKQQEDYTQASWNIFQSALSAARSVLEDQNADQTQVDSAKSALEEAIAGLQRITFTVEFKNVEESDAYAPQTLNSREKARRPADPVKEGYVFKGWYQGDAAEEYDFETAVTENIILTARWQVKQPAASPGSGSVTAGTEVELLATEGADIYYILDEGTPTIESTRYTQDEKIVVTGDTLTIRAIAVKEGYLDSEPAVFTYTTTKADTAALEELFNSYAEVEQEEYTSESFKALENALRKAMEVLQKEKPSLQEVREATENLTEAVKNLTLDWGDILEKDRKELTEIPTGIWTAGIQDLVYDGTAQTQNLRVYDGKVMLTAGKDYTTTYKNNVNAYEYEKEDYEIWKDKVKESPKTAGYGTFVAKKAPQVTLKMKGSYKGSKTLHFAIERLSMTDDSISANDIYVTYNGGIHKPAAEVTFHGKKLSKKDFEVKEYSDGTVSGNGLKGDAKQSTEIELHLKGKKNFKDEKRILLTIGKQSGEISVSKLKIEGVKGKKAQWTKEGAVLSDYVVKDGSTQLTEGTDYTVTYRNNRAVGTATMVIAGSKNVNETTKNSYHGVKYVNFDVTGTSMSEVSVEGVDTEKGYTYTGKDIELLQLTKEGSSEKAVAVKWEGKLLQEGVDFTAEYQKNRNKGTAFMILKGKPEAGFTGTKKIKFRINAAELSEFDVYLNGQKAETEIAVPYTTGGTAPVVTLSKGEGENKVTLAAGTDYTVKYKNHKAVTTDSSTKLPTVEIKGKGNYITKNSIEVKFRIIQRNADEDSAETEMQIAAADKIENLNAAKEGWKQSFKLVDSNKKTVNKREYEKTEYLLTQVPEEAAEEVKQLVSTDLCSKPQAKIPAGSVITVRVTLKEANGNYKGTVEGSYRILEKDHDISKAVFSIVSKEYTGKDIEITSQEDFSKANVKGTKLKLGENFEVVKYENNREKGTARITLRGVGEYGGEKSVTFKITQREAQKNWWDGIKNSVSQLFD